MKLRKILVSISLIIVSTLFMFGCANIEFIRAVDANGVILDRLVVDLKKDELGTYYDSVKQGVMVDMDNFVTYVNKWVDDFQADYPDVYLVLKDGLIVNPPVINQKSDEYILSIEFKNWQIFAIFYGLADIENVEYERAVEDIGPFLGKILKSEYSKENMGLFLYKYSQIKDSGVMSGIESFGVNGTNYFEKYSTLTDNHFDMSDMELTQIFAYPDDRLRSNADTVEVTGGMTFCAWNLNNLTEPMSIYKIAPRAINWYILALVLTVIISIILYFAIKSRHKNDKFEKITKQEIEGK